MELEEAKGVVNTLANGVDPVTGEVFAEDSPYNHPRIIRALFVVLGSVRLPKRTRQTAEEKQQANLEAGRPRNAGLPWTDSLKTELAQRFREGHSIHALSDHFERSRGAITSELAKQGLIEKD